MKRFMVRLSDETYEQLEKLADQLGLGVSVLARAMLKESIEGRSDFSTAVNTVRDDHSGGDSRSRRNKKKKK